MIIFNFLVFIIFYFLFRNEIKKSHYLLLVFFIIRLLFLNYYIINNNYVGLLDDIVYYHYGTSLLPYTPYNLLIDNINKLFIVAKGQHILYPFINFIIYYLFGANIFNMLCYNFVIFLLSLYVAKKLFNKIFNNEILLLLFLNIYLVYPEFIAFSILNLKDITLLYLINLLLYFSYIFSLKKHYIKIIFNILGICLVLLLLCFIRFYLPILYIIAVGIYLIFVKKLKFKLHYIYLAMFLIIMIKLPQFYRFALSPFVSNIANDYYFYKIPALFNWFFIFPFIFYALCTCKNEKLCFLSIFFSVASSFYLFFGDSVGINGSRQRLFLETIYIIYFSFAMYKVYKEKAITIFNYKIYFKSYNENIIINS